MNWFDWTLVAWFALSSLSAIAMIGKPRKPVDPGTAMVITAVSAALIAGLLVTR